MEVSSIDTHRSESRLWLQHGKDILIFRAIVSTKLRYGLSITRAKN